MFELSEHSGLKSEKRGTYFSIFRPLWALIIRVMYFSTTTHSIFFAKLYIILAFSIINYSFPQANILANIKKMKFILFDGHHSFLQIMHQTATCFFIDWKIIILKLIVLCIMYFKSRKEHFWHKNEVKIVTFLRLLELPHFIVWIETLAWGPIFFKDGR